MNKRQRKKKYNEADGKSKSWWKRRLRRQHHVFMRTYNRIDSDNRRKCTDCVKYDVTCVGIFRGQPCTGQLIGPKYPIGTNLDGVLRYAVAATAIPKGFLNEK